jgi:hypothetical protein
MAQILTRGAKRGTTAASLSKLPTGRGGVGLHAAKAEQQEILRLLKARGAICDASWINALIELDRITLRGTPHFQRISRLSIIGSQSGNGDIGRQPPIRSSAKTQAGCLPLIFPAATKKERFV